MTLDIPVLPGVLTREDVRRTVEYLSRVQEPTGAVPWFRGGHTDIWDHVECAMALLAGGDVDAAERAYAWLFESQRADGSWPIKLRQGTPVDAGTDSNHVAYVAVGIWHHWLVRQDKGFVQRAWPAVRRALDRVTAMQLPFGGIAWSAGRRGNLADQALVAGSSSIFHSLSCGVALSELVDEPQPEWELAAGRLAHALRRHEDLFDARTRFSMDWYYPVLGGAVRAEAALARLNRRWHDFVVPGVGGRCVDDRPWVTGAETCELVLSLDTVGLTDAATDLFSDVQHLRDDDGAYWTGYVFADDARWPLERSTWTAAAAVLAVDALSRTTPGSGVFRGDGRRLEFPEIALECGCETSDTRAQRIS